MIAVLLDKSLRVVDGRMVGNPSTDTEALEKDWLARRQEDPFWIRPDGTVRNGNRRLALVKRLQEKQGIEQFEFVDAIFLGPDIDEQAMFEMEQHEQLTEGFKVRYTDINLLLAIRDAAELHKIDWNDSDSINSVAGLIQHAAGDDPTYAAIQLQAIRYMDAYLNDLNAPGQYQKLLRQVERFRDVGKNMVSMEQDYPDDAPDMLRLMFAAIRAGNPHGDIRALRRIYIDEKERFRQLVSDVEELEEQWEQSGEHSIEDPDLEVRDEPEEDEDDDGEPAGPVVKDYPATSVSIRIKNAIDGYKASAELDVASTLEQALERLLALTDDRDRLTEALEGDDQENIRAKVQEIIAWADAAKEQLDSNE